MLTCVFLVLVSLFQFALTKGTFFGSYTANVTVYADHIYSGDLLFDANHQQPSLSRLMMQVTWRENGDTYNGTFFSDAGELDGFVWAKDKVGASSAYSSCNFQGGKDVNASAPFNLSPDGWLGDLTSINVTRKSNGNILYARECSYRYECHVFSLSNIYGTGRANSGYHQLEVTAKGVPVSLALGSSYGLTMVMFETFSPVASKLPAFALPETCVGKRCKSNSTEVQVELYRQHGNSTLFKQLNDTNLADLLGEIYWLCDYHGQSPIISKYRLTVSPEWSQYALCNSGSCSANSISMTYGIGKQYNDYSSTTTDGICGPMNVTMNRNVTCQGSSCGGAGTWYSFPSRGRCAPNMPVGTNGCRWRNEYTTLKSVALECLHDKTPNNFACTNHTVGEMADLFEAAWAACPDVQDTMLGNESFEQLMKPI
eukprot:TRINITY_DN6021_c0_g1_i2.p1 TRINITY_DN6021_c0_g1~~TRINITY_DN6021_c0_g1_i2.p1  ORF type:complete len:442 (+),score=109.23 TRINITY_DN6021_c0_g1_i2:46-1326(+)